MKPSKLRRVLKHKDKLLGLSGERDLRSLCRVREGQGGMIAREGMSAPVSHGMTRSPGSGNLNLRMQMKASENHLRDICRYRDDGIPVRLLMAVRWNMISLGKSKVTRIPSTSIHNRKA